MRTHTNAFKQEIAQIGRQINGRIYYYRNYNLATEDNNILRTETGNLGYGFLLTTEQINASDKQLIDDELIYSMTIAKNGQLLQSLMKEFDFEVKTELKVGDVVNPQFGVLVNNSYEYLNYGNYIIYSKEYNAENETWNYVAYDYMLKSMLPYKPLNITYPCTIRDYIIALANRIGLTFTNANDNFTNYDQQVLAEPFDGMDITYRDVLDKLSETTASNILINDNDELELGYPNETNDTIDEENLKDVNVNFSEKIGPINRVAITETDGGYEYPAEDTASITLNGKTQINIVDNEFAFNGDSNTIASNILAELNGLYYYINDFATTGVCYYDYLDLFNVNIGENTYKCLLLNNEININQGIEENIFTNKLENSEKESDNYKTSVMNSKEVSFKINKQKGEIESRVEKDGIISAINQSAEQVQIDARKISLNGKIINLTADNVTIDSEHLDILSDGTIKLTTDSNAVSNGVFELENTYFERKLILTGAAIYNYDTEDDSLAYRLDDQYLIIGNNSDDYYGSYGKTDWEINNGSNVYTRCNAGSQPYSSSDRRIKENIKNIDVKKSVNIIKELKPVEYTYKGQKVYHRGLIAQDVEQALNKNDVKNEVYLIDENGYYSLNYAEFIPDLINCIKYQQEQIEALQKQVQDLERKIK